MPESVWKSVTFDGKVAGVPTIAQVYNVFAEHRRAQGGRDQPAHR